MLAEATQQRPGAVRRWEVREGLALWRQLLRSQAAASWRHAELVWALLAPHQKKAGKPPGRPPILDTTG